MTPADHSREMLEEVPGADLVVLPDAGHLLMLEHPDIVSDHLRDLVERPLRHPCRELGRVTRHRPRRCRAHRSDLGGARRPGHRLHACAELAAVAHPGRPRAPPPGAEVLLVGEAPGAQEDAVGVPFVGRSGQLLDSLLDEAGLPRDQVAVANVLKCRPPANRKPRRAEVARCRPWLDRQIELIDPAVVVALGGTAAEWFFGPGARIATLRGRA